MYILKGVGDWICLNVMTKWTVPAGRWPGSIGRLLQITSESRQSVSVFVLASHASLPASSNSLHLILGAAALLCWAGSHADVISKSSRAQNKHIQTLSKLYI